MDDYHRAVLDDAYERFKEDLKTTSALAAARDYDGRDRDLWALLVALADYQVSVRGKLLPMLLALSDYLRASGETITEAITSDRAAFRSFEWRGEPGRRGWEHRFLRGQVFEGLLNALSYLVAEHGSVTDLARSLYRGDVAELIFSLAREIRKGASQTVKDLHALSLIAPDPDRDPNERSTMKTLTLYVRWMARREYPDMGLWDFIDPSLLYPSINEGTARTINRVFFGKDAGSLRVGSQKWRDVESARDLMRKINPKDPAKYDYVFSRPSIMGYCARDFESRTCRYCPLREMCRASRVPEAVGEKRALKSPEENAILERHLVQLGAKAEWVDKEVPLGRYRADAIIHFRGDGDQVAEVERELNDAAVGQVLKYRHEYYRLMKKMPKATIVVKVVRDDELRRSLESELGIDVAVADHRLSRQTPGRMMMPNISHLLASSC